MNDNNNLSSARRTKNDEFYTLIEDIEKELLHYKQHLAGKTIYCPCDNPEWSSFYLYFKREFKALGLEALITTHFLEGRTSYKRVFDGSEEVDTPLEGNGDFRSDECKAILGEADIVITNPPFSLFREFISLLISKNKRLLVVGNVNAITYKEIFGLIKKDKLWLGVSPRSMTFLLPDGNTKEVNACWFTNLVHQKRNTPLVLTEKYYE